MSDFKRYTVLKDVPTTTSGGITSAIGTADQLCYSYLCPVSGVEGDLAKLLEAAAKEIERLREMEIDDRARATKRNARNLRSMGWK